MELFDYLKSANRSLFRFESLQNYKVEKEDISDEGMSEWWNFIKSKNKAGVTMQRVRLIVEPLTDYTEHELDIHRKSKSFGDDIKIIKENTFRSLNISKEDFWLVDDKIVLKMNYSLNGEYQGFEVIKNDINGYINSRDILLKNSINL